MLSSWCAAHLNRCISCLVTLPCLPKSSENTNVVINRRGCILIDMDVKLVLKSTKPHRSFLNELLTSASQSNQPVNQTCRYKYSSSVSGNQKFVKTVFSPSSPPSHLFQMWTNAQRAGRCAGPWVCVRTPSAATHALASLVTEATARTVKVSN